MSKHEEPSSERRAASGMIQIDLGEAGYGSLANLAGRVGSLVRDTSIQADPNVLRSLDDLLGAIYALILAKVNDFEERPDRSPELQPVITRAEQLQRGEIRLGGRWIAGWYFNSALFRVAAVYHRLLKVVGGDVETKKYVGDLLKIVKPAYENWTRAAWPNDNLEAIHIEVTNLKHSPQGIHLQRKATPHNAVAAVGELLDLIEAWSHHKLPRATAPPNSA